jgi:ribonuclease BN (tRNA processing enzyme)
MKVIVLGNHGPFPGADGACSGFLLQDNDTNILIDCGSGVAGRLQKYCKLEDLNAIVLSHLHSDHSSDMFVLRYAMQAKLALKSIAKPLEVYTPVTPEAYYRELDYNGVFRLHNITDDMKIEIEGFKFTFYKTAHMVECYGMRIEKDRKVFAYSADTTYHENIIKLAEGSDLFLCEANATENIRKTSKPPHLSVKEACDIARKAKAKKLLLTHFWFEEPRENYTNDALGEFDNVILSEELTGYDI